MSATWNWGFHPQVGPVVVTVVHHICALCARRRNFFAWDLCLIAFEITWSFMSFFLFSILDLFPLVNLVMLSAFLYARLAGWRDTTFDFFAGCNPQVSQYMPLEILFGQPASRPLVRGESKAIVSIRATLLFSLCVVIPGWGIYVTLVVPITAQVFTRNLKTSHSWYPDSLPYANAYSPNSVVLAWYPPEGFSNITISWTVGNATEESVISAGLSIAMCRSSWSWVPTEGVVVRANFTAAWGTLYVKAGEGIPADVDRFSEPIPLHAGSHLSAILSITERRIFSMTAMDLLGLVTPTRSIILRPVLLLQEDKTPPNFGSDTASLRLRPRTDFISSTNVVQDYTDASILNGIATFGGFWTFMDGTFAILFGANILYFLYGSRPLSPLGFIHFFQRRTLMRRWNEDFPAFRTEGGQPGTENAGIVAFMRERFVDITSERPKTKDAEPQHLSEDVTQVKGMQEKGNGVSSSGRGVEKDGDVQDCHWEPGEEEGGLESGFAYLAGVA